MASADTLMALGTSAELARVANGGTKKPTKASAGSAIGDAAAMEADTVLCAAGSSEGIQLPDKEGMFVVGASGNNLAVYPHSASGKINNGSAGAAKQSQPVTAASSFVLMGSIGWQSAPSPNSSEARTPPPHFGVTQMADHYFGRDAALADLENEPGAVQRQTNKGMAIAKFFKGQVKDEAKSAAQGRICYRDVDMIQVIIPGDKHNVVMRKIKPSDKVNYPKQYEAFRKMEEFVPEGTLIDNWPLLSRSQIEDMKYQGIFTVEQLANLPRSVATSRHGRAAHS
jgi:hypothetical protein